MKAKTLLIAAAMILAFSAAAFAQATFQVGSTPVTAVVKTGNTERVGDLTFTNVNGAIATGTFTITYPGQITNAFAQVCKTGSTAAADCANLTAGSSFLLSGGVPAGTATFTISQNPTTGQVTVAVVAGATGAGVGASFTVSGVRIQVNGTALAPPLSASISAVTNFIVAGQTNAVVVSGIGDGIKSVAAGTASVNGTTLGITPASGTSAHAWFNVTEGFNNAFGKNVVDDATDMTTGVIVRLTINALPPAGVNINFPTTAATYDSALYSSSTGGQLGGIGVASTTGGLFTAVNSDWTANSAPAFKSDSSSLSIYYKITSSTSATLTEFLSIPITISTSSSKATLPLAAASFTLTATFAPVQPATGTSAVDRPRFAAAESSAGTILSIIGNTTSLLMPYASVALGYDTGIAISNSSTDPGKTPLGLTDAGTPNAGPITFYLYQQQVGTTAPKSFTYTTGAASPGSGLDSSGNVPSGSTYVVLLSQILGAIPSGPTTFSGYIFVSCGFTNAHGQYTLSNFTTYSSASLMLVVNYNSLAANNRTASGESLKF